MQVSVAATLVGLEVPERPSDLELKPYAIADLTSDRNATPPIANDLGGDLGLDVKYGVTQNLVADLTVNTDFAQVEADEQQVNLTRFSLFFPEKREFFLENQGTFAFGGAGTGTSAGGDNTPVLFYSRRIGLNEGHEVPIQAGGRLTGRVGAFSVGALHIRTGDEAVSDARTTDFSIVRVKRDLLRRSSVGALLTRRSLSINREGSSETYGLDGTFAFYDDLDINTYWAKTQTPGQNDDVSYRAQLDYRGDRYGVEVERLVIGAGFSPEVGFLLRDDFERSLGSFRFSPRPRSITAIRKFSWNARLDYITDRAGVVETRETEGRFGIEFENSDTFDVTYVQSYEFLDEPFPIAADVTIPVGGYSFQSVSTSFTPRSPTATLWQGVGSTRELLRRAPDARGIHGQPPRGHPAAVRRAGSVGQLDRPSGGELHDHARHDARDLHHDASDVRERARAAQLEQRVVEREPEAAVGVPAGQ